MWFSVLSSTTFSGNTLGFLTFESSLATGTKEQHSETFCHKPCVILKFSESHKISIRETAFQSSNRNQWYSKFCPRAWLELWWVWSAKGILSWLISDKKYLISLPTEPLGLQLWIFLPGGTESTVKCVCVCDMCGMWVLISLLQEGVSYF